MKKVIYETPSVEVVEMEIQGIIADSAKGEEGGFDDD